MKNSATIMSYRVMDHLLNGSLKNHRLEQLGRGHGKTELLMYECVDPSNEHELEQAARKAASALTTKMFSMGKPVGFIELSLPASGPLSVSSASNVNQERTVCVRVVVGYSWDVFNRRCVVNICPVLE